MNKFTAQDAREIVSEESFSTRGYVIDKIKKAAKNGQTSITIPDMKLHKVAKDAFIEDGFFITGNSISWKKA